MTTASPASLPSADELPPPVATRHAASRPAHAATVGKRAAKGRTAIRRWVLVVGALIIVLFLAGVVAIFGRVSGREFSPTHFETRSFWFVEIPLLQLQVMPIRRTSQVSRLSTYLATSGLINRPQGPPAQWHLVELGRFAAQRPADAKLLSDFLEHRRGVSSIGELYWHQWSTEHPELAAILWPEVQKLAERELYLLIPELFQIAELADSADTFAADLHTALSHGYARLIRDLDAAGQTELAESFRRDAVRDYPEDPRWQSPQ